ncbi:MAG: class I SAM-dependent methyltransferase [Bacteroidota bacterium]|nr:class I SAM-dependent methyltransferase [Bacteroidota bacterium]
MIRKFRSFFNYWVFIGTNWNFSLATFTIFHEIRGEKKYGLDTLRIDRLKSLSVKGDNKIHGSIYQGCNYFVLEKGFDFLKQYGPFRHFVDFGCGKGRALAVAAHYGFNRITGVDFAAALCQEAESNLRDQKIRFPETKFAVLHEDASMYPIEPDQDVFFFFNPFDEVVMLQVVKNLLASLRKHPRKLWVFYANPVDKEIFLSAGFEERHYIKKLQYLELSILSLTPTR